MTDFDRAFLGTWNTDINRNTKWDTESMEIPNGTHNQ